MDQTYEFGVMKKNVMTFLYLVGIWLCQGSFAQENV